MSTLYTVNDVKKLEMKCKDENDYSDPPIMKDKYGNSLYAYVTLVMLGDKYISAAIVLSYTLKKLNTQADLVVLVTNDVSKEGIEILMRFYDKVIEVEFVEVVNWRGIKQSHRKYLNYVFTKFHVFNLTEYKKVLLIDADAMVLKYPDHLFSLPTPAGVYLEDKDLFITYDSKGNYILPTNNKIKWYDEFCECCAHGKLIPKSVTDKILKNKKNSGIGGGLMLLEPKEGELESIVADVKTGNSKYLINNFFVWPEQQYLSIRYSGKWHSINPRFFGLQGYPHWKVLFGLQYAGDKPFILESKFPLKERMKYPDFELWHYFYRAILDENPNLNNHPSLKDANEMNKYYNGIDLSRTTEKFYDNKKIDGIVKYLKINKNNIGDKLDFFYTDSSKPYSYQQTKTLFNVDKNNYEVMLKYLIDFSSKMNTSYFINLYKRYKAVNNNNRIDKLDIDDIDKDTIAMYYAMCRKNMFVMTLWPKSYDIIDKIIELLEKDGDVCYVKKLNLDYNTVRNLAFYMYNEFNAKTRLGFIDKKLAYAGIRKDIENKVTIILFDNINNKPLAGQSSKYKKEIRNFISDLVSINGEKIWGNDLLHVNDYYCDTIEYCQMLFNKNSLDVLKYQNIDRMISDHYSIFFNRYNTIRKWMYNNLSMEQITRLLLMGGTIWFTLGVRPSNDIDGIFVNTHEETYDENNFEKLINKYFVNEKTKFEFADMGLEDSKHWNPKWSEKNNDILKQIDVKSFDDIAYDPRHHYYYGGIKIYKIEYEITRKYLRLRGQDIADLLMLYLNFKNIISNNIQLDSKNKIILPIYANKSIDIKTFEKALKLIKERYPRTDYQNVDINMIKNIFN